MSFAQVVRGPLLNPRPDGTIEWIADAALVGDDRGRIVLVGEWEFARLQLGPVAESARQAEGVIIPPMLDAHIHIPQHPIRGRFLEGVSGNPAEGSLLAGLNRNVFPAEGRCVAAEVARQVVEAFREDTLSHGMIGGAAYMTVHTAATRTALATLESPWNVGLVLMQRNCPEFLRTNEAALASDVAELAAEFGSRVIVTDRFAGAVDTPLRRQGVALSQRYGLRMQTHLNEQFAEKAWIEGLYPTAKHYTDIYRRDGMFDCGPILAHCIRMNAEEFDLVAATSGVAIAHCPVSNTLLGSGVMPLDEVVARKIPYALCTDVGASPTTSLLCEMVQFLRVHAGRSRFATPSEALFRTTLAPAQILGCADRLGSFDIGKEFSFIEVRRQAQVRLVTTADDAIRQDLLESPPTDEDRYRPGNDRGMLIDRLQASGLEVGADLAVLTADVEATARRLDDKVVRVTRAGRTVWSRSPQ